MKENAVKKVVNKHGFTLIELLVVVLIIGILSTIALPMYRKAVEKSRVADALNTMQAVAKSEHGWYLMNNNYTDDFGNLDIDLTDVNGNKADNASFANALYTYELLDTGILAERNNGEYSLYKDYESSQVLCMPGNHYVCENLIPFTKEPCDKLDMAWANSNSTCYVNDEARCKGLYPNNGYWNNTLEICGYANTYKPTINEGMVCLGTQTGACFDVIVNPGGECLAQAQSACGRGIFTGGDCIGNGWSSCQSITITSGTCKGKNQNSCSGSTIDFGGVCEGRADAACRNVTVNSGGKCQAIVSKTCDGDTKYNGTGCCEGAFCQNNAPKCDCPIDENTGKHLTSC